MTQKMNKIEQLIAELCPEGVEFKKMSDVVLKNNFTQVGAGVLEQLKSKTGNVKLLPSSKNYDWWTTEEVAGNYICKGEIITLGRARYANIKYHKGKFVSSNNHIITSKNTDKLINKFLFYFIAHHVSEFYVATSTYPKLDNNIFDNFKIPTPPLEVQEEIVRILDKFTALEAELEAELEARKKQYEYYREQLLTFGDDEVEWKDLESVCISIKAGGDLPDTYKKDQKEPTREFPYPIYSNGTENSALYGYANSYKINKEAVTISARGTIGYHTIRKPKFTPIVRLIVLIPNNDLVLTRYLNYVLDITEIRHSDGSIPQLTTPAVKKIKIPIPHKNNKPDLEKQKQIVAVLDKFDALVNSLSEGLPAEIDARKKQYEHYREKLLTFTPINNQ